MKLITSLSKKTVKSSKILKPQKIVELNIIEPHDILTFFNSNTKDKNDQTNKVRENIISNIFDIADHYFEDPELNSTEWNMVRTKLWNKLSELCSFPFNKIKIMPKGGRGFNHDFVVSFTGENNNQECHKLEFKHNNSNVCGLVQFLELSDYSCKNTHNMFDYSYSEYYYDNFIDSYLKLVSGEIAKPEKQVYITRVQNTDYKHPFFKNIYEDKLTNEAQKKELIQQSCEQYLQLYSHSFKFDKLTEKIKNSQQNKAFLFWDKNDFHIQVLNVENIEITHIIAGSLKPLYFDVNVNNCDYNIRIRLNWGNNNGIANPRWKFTFIHK